MIKYVQYIISKYNEVGMKKRGLILGLFLLLLSCTEVSAAQLPDNVSRLSNGKYQMEIYDIDDGFLQVPFLPELSRHSYEWDKLKLDETTYFMEYEDEEFPDPKIGIDVSKFQGNIDWEQVSESGIDFAIIRLGYRGYSNGRLVLDINYKKNMEGAAAAGIETGVYFFSQAVSKEEAEEEADFVLEALKEYKVGYPVAFDTEKIKFDTYRTEKLTVPELTEITKTFCGRIKKAGYQTMIYANAQWLTTQLDLTKLPEYDIWYADYDFEEHGKAPLYPYEFKMWQYTNKGNIKGIAGNVDMNILFE